MAQTTLSFMNDALAMARQAALHDSVPVGAVVVHKGAVIASAHNATPDEHDPSGHAEIRAMRIAAQKLQSTRLTDCDLWVTLEPCAMCAGAIAHARIRRLYYGASDPKGGAVESGPRLFGQATIHHTPEIYSGIGEDAAAAMLKAFFARKR